MRGGRWGEWSRAASLCVSVSVFALGLERCSSPPPRPPDAPQPTDVRGEVDFSALFGRSFGSNTVLVTNREGGLMRRVMVGPNITFEAARSSLAEPNTVGPANPPPSAPDQSNALGTPVSIADSSRLLRYLIDRGSVVVAPVVSRLWCGVTEACLQATWVERVLMLARAAPQSATAEAAGASDNRYQLPTSLFAVRYLGSSNFERPMVVEEAAPGRYVLRLALYENEPTICPGLRLPVPYVAFSGEVISASSGQVIARIDEVRALATQAPMRRQLLVRTWRPVEATLPYNEGVHRYVGSWSPVSRLCEEIPRQYATLRREIGEAADVSSTVQDIIRSSLDPLYRSESNEPPSRRASVASPPPPPPPPMPEAVATPPAAEPSPAPRARRGRRRR